MSLYDELKRRNVIRVAAAYFVAAWLIIQVAETILPFYDVPDAAIRTLITVLVVLFIPVVVLAWIFEWTPEGIRKDEGATAGGPAFSVAAKRWDRVVMAVLAVAVAYFVVEKILETTETAPAPAIAIMPFTNLSPDPDQAYFAGGVAEEVRTLLGKIPELRVISRGSISKVVDMGLDVAEAAATLNVAHVLEGSVRRSGDRIRITAQLVEAESGTSLWSESYDETLDNIFDIQDEIAGSIVENLHVELVGPMPKARRTDPRALAMLIQAKQIFYQTTIQPSYGDAADRIDRLLDAALELDPGYADAMSWKGVANWIRGMESEISPEEFWRRDAQINEAVLAIDAEHASIWWWRAWQKTFIDVDFAAAVPLWERGYRNAPNDAELLRQVARFAALIGRFDIASPLYERAVSLDPLCTMCLYFLSRNYMWAREWDKAEEARERFLLIGGGGGYYHYGTIKLMQGDAEAALEAYRRQQGGGQELFGIAMALHALGKSEESNAALASAIEKRGEIDPEYAATAYAFRGEKDAAFEWLEKAIASPPDPISGRLQHVQAIVDPLFHSLHDDPRWEQLRMKVGMPTELIESLEFSIDIPH